MNEQLKDPGVQKILGTEEGAMIQLIAGRYMEGRIQEELVKQQIKIEEVDGVRVYTAMPYAVLDRLTDNFFNMMVTYMHPIAEKKWPDKLREMLFTKFCTDYNPKVETLEKIRDFQWDRNPARISNRRFVNTFPCQGRINLLKKSDIEGTMLAHMQWIKDNVSLLTEENAVIWEAKSVVGADPSSPAFIWKSGGTHAYKKTEDGQRVPYKRKKEAGRIDNDAPLT